MRWKKMNKLKYGGSETRTVADDGRIVMSFVMRGLQRSPKGHHRFPGTAGATSQRLVGRGHRRRDVLAFVPPVLNTAWPVSHAAARQSTLYRSVRRRGAPAAAMYLVAYLSAAAGTSCYYMLLLWLWRCPLWPVPEAPSPSPSIQRSATTRNRKTSGGNAQ